MKKRSLIVSAFLGLALTLGFTACDDDEVSPGLEYESQGFIKGDITGVSEDGSYVFDDDFKYSNYSLLLSTFSTYELNDDGSYEISLRRADFDDYGNATIGFTLDDENDTTPDGISISLTWAEEDDDRIVTFSMGSSGNTATITEFSFNPETGRAKGKFSLSGDNNSTDNNALVTGSFDVIAKPIVQ